jgi:plastocyanin
MIADNAFNPTGVTVSPGTTVTWKWAACTPDNGGGYGGGYGTSCPTHNVTFDDGSNIASQTQDAGEFSRSFAAAGTYKYHCTIHGAAVMSGQVVVK